MPGLSKDEKRILRVCDILVERKKLTVEGVGKMLQTVFGFSYEELKAEAQGAGNPEGNQHPEKSPADSIVTR